MTPPSEPHVDLLIPADQIRSRVEALGREISHDYAGSRNGVGRNGVGTLHLTYGYLCRHALQVLIGSSSDDGHLYGK